MLIWNLKVLLDAAADVKVGDGYANGALWC